MKLLMIYSFIFTLCIQDMYAENTYFRKGYSTNGDILYNWDGTYLRKGYSSNGDILYNVDGKIPTAVLIYILH